MKNNEIMQDEVFKKCENTSHKIINLLNKNKVTPMEAISMIPILTAQIFQSNGKVSLKIIDEALDLGDKLTIALLKSQGVEVI